MPSIDRLYSAEKRIDEKIDWQTIKDKINSGVEKLPAAAQQLAKTLNLKIDSFFKTADFPKVAAAGAAARPEVARTTRPSLGGAGILLFPAEMKYYTMFAFKQYNRGFALKAADDKPTATIILPMPSNLTESFAVSYENEPVGPVVGALTQGLTNQARNQGMDDGGDAKSLATGAAIVSAVALRAIKTVSEAAGAPGVASATKMVAGIAPNPHLAVIFQDIGLREHTFSYKFAPRSADEMLMLKRIIKHLKKSLLPGLSTEQSVMFSFPDVCDISFGPYKDSPYRIKRCVMTSLSINHAAGGTVAFHRGGDPVMVEINMTFREMGVYTRADMAREAQIDLAAVKTQDAADQKALDDAQAASDRQAMEDAASGRQSDVN